MSKAHLSPVYVLTSLVVEVTLQECELSFVHRISSGAEKLSEQLKITQIVNLTKPGFNPLAFIITGQCNDFSKFKLKKEMGGKKTLREVC